MFFTLLLTAQFCTSGFKNVLYNKCPKVQTCYDYKYPSLWRQQTAHVFPTCFSTPTNSLCVLFQGVSELSVFEEVVPFVLEPGQVRRKGPGRSVQVTRVHRRSVPLLLSSGGVCPLPSAIGHPLLRGSLAVGVVPAASAPAPRPASRWGLVRSRCSAAGGFLLRVPHGCSPSAVRSNSSCFCLRAAASTEPVQGISAETAPWMTRHVRRHGSGGSASRCSAAAGQDWRDHRLNIWVWWDMSDGTVLTALMGLMGQVWWESSDLLPF